jgi:hypothetical protein
MFDDILADLDAGTLDWLVMELDDAALRADNTYVQAEYQDRQNDVSEAIWKIARLVEAAWDVKDKV